jgi:hypothetical protein
MQNIPFKGAKLHIMDSVTANKKKMLIATAAPTVPNRDTNDFNFTNGT